MREKAVLFALLFLLPALAGCTVPSFDAPKRWALEIPLGLLVSPRAQAAAEDVAASAELAARQIQTSELGATVRLRQDAAADSVTAAFDRLAALPVAAVVAAVAPDEAKALADRAAAKKVPLLLVTPGDPAPSSVQWALQLAPPSASLGAALAERTTTPAATVFRLDDVFTRAVADAFDAAYAGDASANVTLARGQQGAAISAGRAACDDAGRTAVLLLPAKEAGWVVRGYQEGGCRSGLAIVAAPSARSQEFVTEAGRDPATNQAYAAGALGVEPAGSRLAEFRTFFATEYDRDPGAFAAEAYDAVLIATLAAFDAKGSPGAKPVRATITAAELQPRLLTVAEGPGVKHRDLSSAIDAAKDGDDVEWAGYAHDYAFSGAGVPEATAYDAWQVTPTGGIERAR